MSHAFSILLNYSYENPPLIAILFGIVFVAYKRPLGPLAPSPLGFLGPGPFSWVPGPKPLGPRVEHSHGACKARSEHSHGVGIRTERADGSAGMRGA